MSLSPAYDLALNDMLASYTKDDASKNQANANLVKAAAAIKVAPKVKLSPNQVPASNGAEQTVVINTAPVIKIDAMGYIKAVREAGYKLDTNGKRFFDPSSQRDAMMKAIDAYIGYDPRGDFASQELAARTQAGREIRLAQGGALANGPTRAEVKRTNASISGFVAGMPDTTTRELANLEARERLAVSVLIEQEKLAETAATDQEKGKALAFAQVERERLISIRADLKAHGK